MKKSKMMSKSQPRQAEIVDMKSLSREAFILFFVELSRPGTSSFKPRISDITF